MCRLQNWYDIEADCLDRPEGDVQENEAVILFLLVSAVVRGHPGARPDDRERHGVLHQVSSLLQGDQPAPLQSLFHKGDISNDKLALPAQGASKVDKRVEPEGSFPSILLQHADNGTASSLNRWPFHVEVWSLLA